MAQENANILHAAIAIRSRADLIPVGTATIIAATGVDLASVRSRQDLVGIGAAIVYQVDLVAGIDDPELICASMNGPVLPPEGTPPVGAMSFLAHNITRPPLSFDPSAANVERRRFWITSIEADTFYVSWWRIPGVVETLIPIIPAPAA